MEKNKTLSEVYKNSSDEVKEILKNKFSNEELGIKFVPKNGDVCIDKNGMMAIAKGKQTSIGDSFVYCIIDHNGRLLIEKENLSLAFNSPLPASEEEKQKFFNALQEKGYKWNKGEKKIEKIKWRAKEGEYFYFISSFLCVEHAIDYYDIGDLTRYKMGNYFRTKEEAKFYLKKVKDIFQENYNNL